MKHSNAIKLVERLAKNKVCKLRANKHGGMSSVTWCAICDILINNYGAISVNYKKTSNYSKYWTISYETKDSIIPIILNDSIVLY